MLNVTQRDQRVDNYSYLKRITDVKKLICYIFLSNFFFYTIIICNKLTASATFTLYKHKRSIHDILQEPKTNLTLIFEAEYRYQF